MHYELSFGRDSTEGGSKTGPQVERNLSRSLRLYLENPSGVRLVVAPCREPSLLDESPTSAEVMAAWLTAEGCDKEHVIVLEADSFDTDGELRAFRKWCLQNLQPGDTVSVRGADWHLKRARVIAYVIDVMNLWRWARSLEWRGYVEPMSDFDRKIERLKLIKALMPKWLHPFVVGTYKRLVSKRTSY